MTHLKSINIENFRSWENGFIEFSPGVNIIIGDNDSGKTNILRMIDWVANNNPKGWDSGKNENDYQNIRSEWGGNTAVTLTIENKDITRFRSNSENKYFLTGYKDPFEGFGTKVPQVISDFLNMSDINFSFQMDGPFLLSKTSPEVARYYNNLVDLDIIDRSISNINKVVLAYGRDVKVQKNIQKEKEEEVKAFNWLNEAEKILIDLEKQETLLIHKNNEFSLLSQYIKTVKDIDLELENLNKILIHKDKVDELIKLSDGISKLKSDKDLLYGLIQKIKSLDLQIEKEQKIIKFEKDVGHLINLNSEIKTKTDRYNELFDLVEEIEEYDKQIKESEEKTKYENQVNSLIKLSDSISVKTKEHNELFDLVKTINKYNKEIQFLESDINKHDLEFIELMPSICPLCGK